MTDASVAKNYIEPTLEVAAKAYPPDHVVLYDNALEEL
jgi:hypothetical protein